MPEPPGLDFGTEACHTAWPSLLSFAQISLSYNTTLHSCSHSARHASARTSAKQEIGSLALAVFLG